VILSLESLAYRACFFALLIEFSFLCIEIIVIV